ncbi:MULTISPECIES: disulfide isomerase DsbC N-terminal domain-containing protein [unclassified Variovorax]|uniref:disulfide isomerase DsbC N-terminal domain-containing protein n=1 Tax=unclassified Variovorax TaxID=663243 RepID=UPI000838345B|nr:MULTISPECIES: disulfide isomerase DsbC N-terminal domain-containing protein [unclassified Variovorax]
MPAAEVGGRLTQLEADEVLSRLRGTLRGTRFLKAWPAAVPGLVTLQLENGEVAYADKSARYFLMGVVFDTATGKGLDRQMDPTDTNE